MLLASCSYEESRKYSGKLVVDGGEENSKKAEEVLLNIVTDDIEEVYSKGLGSARCVSVGVSPRRCPEGFRGNVFRLYSWGDCLDGVSSEVEGVVPLLVLPDGFCDMREIYRLACSYPRLRFIGGNLLGIPSVGIGRYDKGKEKMSAVFNGIYDIFREVNLADIKVRRVVSKAGKSGGSSSSKKAGGSSSLSKKREVFNNFFGGGGTAF